MLDIALLQEPIAAADGPTSLQTGDERLEEISQLAMDGEYLLAADRCQKLLEQKLYDARLVGYFLFGVFTEQGTAAMLPIFQTVKQCLTVNLPAIGPPGKRDILLDSALQWLFTAMLKQLEHAERKHDAAWQSLIELANVESVRQMNAELTAVSAAAAKLVKRPRAVQSISHMEQLLKQAHNAIEVSAESMRLSALSQASGGAKAAAQAEKGKTDGKSARFDTSDLKGADRERGPGQKKREPARSDPEPKDEDADADEGREDYDEDHDDDADAEDRAPKRARAAAAEDSDDDEDAEGDPEESAGLPELPREEEPSRGKAARAAIRAEDGQGRSITIEGSPALLDLVRRIKAFERLTQRGDLLKAAVVADSVLATLDAFDPRVFFPKLLLPFFSGLSEHAPELEAAMAERDSLTFRSLKQLLQLDVDALMK